MKLGRSAGLLENRHGQCIYRRANRLSDVPGRQPVERRIYKLGHAQGGGG